MARENSPEDPADIRNRPPSSGDRRPGDDVAADRVVDEKGSPIDVPPEKRVESTDGTDPAVGATSPTNWWRTGLILLAVLIALIILLQMMTGGSVTPTETPDTAPMTETPETDTLPADPSGSDVTPEQPATDAPPAEDPPPTTDETTPAEPAPAEEAPAETAPAEEVPAE